VEVMKSSWRLEFMIVKRRGISDAPVDFDFLVVAIFGEG